MVTRSVINGCSAKTAGPHLVGLMHLKTVVHGSRTHLSGGNRSCSSCDAGKIGIKMAARARDSIS